MAKKYQIDKGVPIPFAHDAKVVYPFGSMEVGDSFHFEKDRYHSVISSKRQFCIKHEAGFTVRQLDDGSYRIWRTF